MGYNNKNIFGGLYSNELSAKAAASEHTFPEIVDAIQIIADIGSDDCFFTLGTLVQLIGDSNYGKFNAETPDPTRADNSTVKIVAGQVLNINVRSKSIKYVCAAGNTATLQVVGLVDERRL